MHVGHGGAGAVSYTHLDVYKRQGIDPADQGHVFERFFRGDRSRSSEGGTGLGLSIVKHAALAHGAKVSLTSKVGKGTSVRVDFPA